MADSADDGCQETPERKWLQAPMSFYEAEKSDMHPYGCPAQQIAPAGIGLFRLRYRSIVEARLISTAGPALQEPGLPRAELTHGGPAEPSNVFAGAIFGGATAFRGSAGGAQTEVLGPPRCQSA